MQVSRRGLLAGAAAGGGLLVAWWLMPRNYRTPLVAARGEHVFGAYLKIAADGVVTVAVPQLEMGQGITTLLPQIIAHELGADWRQIAVEPAPVSGAYANVPLARKWIALWDPIASGLSEAADSLMADRFAAAQRFSATAAGTSIEAYEMPCREAAAAARAMLAQ
jgi:isoquinoline 1-oxidoreductase beta subunit